MSCRTASGRKYIVEMHKGRQTHFIERCEYYVSRGIAEQGYKGVNEENESWDFSLLPVVGVFFCNFKVPGLPQKPLVKASLRDDESGELISHHQRYAFIQLPFFKKKENECNTLIDQWIYNIKNMGTTQTVAFATQNEIFKYLESVSNVAALNPRERKIYEACLMRARDYNAVLKCAKEEALEEGRAEGRAEGRKEANLLTAKRMLELGMDVDLISMATGLSVDEIKAL